MTAPGQEPDEVMTATPEGKDERADEPVYSADKVGDNHMPKDLRESEQERAARLDDGESETVPEPDADDRPGSVT